MKHAEDQLQKQVADYLRWQYPKLLWIHCPNGGYRNPREAARFKSMGVLPGVADLLIFCPKNVYNGLCIELKVKPNKQSDSQKEFEKRIKEVYWDYHLCYTFEDAKNIIDKYLSL